jgi:hypothetical protein
MPPPEMKCISFPRPSLLELNKECCEDFSKAMIPKSLLQTLKDASGDSNVAMAFLPKFGFLYIATDSKIHQFDSNLMELKLQPFQIVVTATTNIVQLLQQLDDAGIMKPGKNIVFRFGPLSEQTMEQAKMVANEMQDLLGCEEIKVVVEE